MSVNSLLKGTLCVHLLGMAVSSIAVADVTSYKVEVIGTLGGTISDPKSINSSGTIVGYSRTSSGVARGFSYRNGVLRDIKPSYDNEHFAIDINDAGDILRKERRPDRIDMVTSIEGNGSSIEIPIPGECVAMNLNKMNMFRDAVGFLQCPINGQYRFTGVAYVFGHVSLLTRYGFETASDINRGGIAVGDSNYLSSGTAPAMMVNLYEPNSQPEYFGILEGRGHSVASAYSINESGQVVGYSATGSFGDLRPYIYRDGVTTELARPANAIEAIAFDVNNVGLAVGTATLSNGSARAVIWDTQKNQVFDLNNLLVLTRLSRVITEALSINDRGQIAAVIGEGNNRVAVLLDPVRGRISRNSVNRGVASHKRHRVKKSRR